MTDWFEFNGVKCTEYGIHVSEHPAVTLPSERVSFTDVPGRNGSLTTLEGDAVYSDMTLTATCFVSDMSRLSEIAAWLKGSGTVTFANRQGGFYYGRIINQIPFEKVLRGKSNRTFAVNFRVKPFFYLEDSATITLTESTQFLENPGSVYSDNRNGLLSEVQYGNGGKVSYAYDDYDRLTGVKYDGESSDRYTYEYGANGQAVEVKDANLNRTVRTDYDLADRPCQVEAREGGDVLYRNRLKYDKLGNLEQFAENAGGEAHKTEYEYDRDNRVTKLTYDGGNIVSYAYDELGRVSSRTDGVLTSTYGYVSGGYGTNSTTPLVASITNGAISFTYAYDNRSNIISETRNGVTTTYSYDALGQLIRVNDPVQNQTWVFNYDRGGNIISRVRYAYTTGTLGTALETIPYTYGDSNWKDKLTAYNGKTITYDAIGNPTNDGVWSYEWQAGRQLKRMSAEGTALTFKYDHNGLRTQKVVEASWYPETTNYFLHGKLITHMTVEYYDWDEVKHTDKLHFFYDAQSRPAQVSFNGTVYTYIHNLQGDIVGLLDSTGALVVEYKYDAWGKPLSVTGNLADTLGKRNPFRYRGYVYDEETGLYYLRSRYYNPTVGRFVNADSSIIHKNNIFGCNVFAYAYNNPIMYADADGTLGKWVRSLIVTAVSTVAVVAVSVVAAPVVATVVAGAVIGAGANMLVQTVVEDKDFDEVDYADVAIAGVSGAACSCIPGSAASSIAARATVSSLIENVSAFWVKKDDLSLGDIFGDIVKAMIGEATFGLIGKGLEKLIDCHLLGGNTMQPRHFKQAAANAGRTLSRTAAKRQVRYGKIVRETVKKVVSAILDAISAICSEVAGVYVD